MIGLQLTQAVDAIGIHFLGDVEFAHRAIDARHIIHRVADVLLIERIGLLLVELSHELVALVVAVDGFLELSHALVGHAKGVVTTRHIKQVVLLAIALYGLVGIADDLHHLSMIEMPKNQFFKHCVMHLISGCLHREARRIASHDHNLVGQTHGILSTAGHKRSIQAVDFVRNKRSCQHKESYQPEQFFHHFNYLAQR